MSRTGGTSKRLDRLADWLAVLAARRVPVAGGFVSQPEPRSIGHYARGKQLVSGHFLMAGHLVEAPGTVLWDIAAPDRAFGDEGQCFAWLDDLAALGTKDAQKLAQLWTWSWIDRFGTGRGPGWTPDLAGRRIIGWIHHATLLLNGRDRAETLAFYRALTVQAAYLARRWHQATEGLARFQALTGLIYAGISLIGQERFLPGALKALAAACDADIDGEGGIQSRNPDELLEVLTLLTWSAAAMSEANQQVPPAVSAAITRIAPALRALRHSDGTLARFHGGGGEIEGQLDHALAAAGTRVGKTPSIAMGYVRLTGSRTTLIVDAAAAPGGRAAATAHASTTAFELCSGRRALVVNCGSGAAFGPAWRQATRTTQSHSTLGLDGASSSLLDASGEYLEHRAAVTASRMTVGNEGADLYLSHDGWLRSHGLTASRSLTLARDGRRLSGVDALTALTDEARRRFEDVMTATAMNGASFAIRFHLHPEVDAALDLNDTAVSLVLRNGEIWIFRFTKQASLTLEPSVYLEKGRLHPRPSTQIVLRGQAHGLETRIGWTLAKAKDTPLAIRDLEVVDLEVEDWQV